MILLVPAYEPGQALIDLLSDVRRAEPSLVLVVVDDGSGPAHAAIFDAVRALGCTVLTHRRNRGKGAALKTGLAHVATHHPGQDVVSADCDGQHRLDDVLLVAARVATRPDALVLGARSFTGAVPVRSRIGNSATRALFRLATGQPLRDTQTGLRGYPAAMLPWLRRVPGERFEYELNVLLEAGPAGYRIDEVAVGTVYLAGNASSHFRPVADSARVYAPLLRFSLSSLTAFGIDAVALFALMATTGNLLLSVVAARTISATVNYLTNRRYVFTRRRPATVWRSATRYGGLVVVLLLANYALMHLGAERLHLGLLPAKVLTEALLFTVSYQLQRLYVFAHPAPVHAPTHAHDHAPHDHAPHDHDPDLHHAHDPHDHRSGRPERVDAA